MKIYTRTGDDGTTGLPSGRRVAKNHPAVSLCGALDEMNCILGAARAATLQEAVLADLKRVQDQVFRLGSEIALGNAGASWPGRITAGDTQWLEAGIDRMTAQLAPLRNFILPGGSPGAAQIHLARAVCRRAEREAVSGGEEHSPGSTALAWLNRLSDFLFTLARFENLLSGFEEEKWTAP